MELTYFTKELIKLAKKDELNNNNKVLNTMIAGGAAGAIATAATIPLDIIATAAGAPGNTKSTSTLVKELYREGKGEVTGMKGTFNGVKRFYQGVGPKVAKVIPMMALTFLAQRSIYDYLDKDLKKNG